MLLMCAVWARACRKEWEDTSAKLSGKFDISQQVSWVSAPVLKRAGIWFDNLMKGRGVCCLLLVRRAHCVFLHGVGVAGVIAGGSCIVWRGQGE